VRPRLDGGASNLALLSFGDEEASADSDDAGAARLKIKSSHDVLTNDPRLSREAAVSADEIARAAATEGAAQRLAKRTVDLQQQAAAAAAGEKRPAEAPSQRKAESSDDDDDDDFSDDGDDSDDFRAQERFDAKMRQKIEKARGIVRGDAADARATAEAEASRATGAKAEKPRYEARWLIDVAYSIWG